MPGLRAAADWTAERLRRLGATVEVLEVDGAPPLVVGEIGDGPRTVSAVQHYDVQPRARSSCGPRRRTSPPSATAASGRAARRTTRASSCRASGPSRPGWRRSARCPAACGTSSRARRRPAAAPSTPCSTCGPDSARPTPRSSRAAGSTSADRPQVSAGGKGIVVLELNVRTMRVDSHSSVASLLPNAGQRLVAALATMWDGDGRPAVAGTRHRDPSTHAGPARHRRRLRPARARRPARAPGHRAIRRRRGRARSHQGPDLRADAESPGPVGRPYGPVTPKTVIPADAHARIDIRIVPEQRAADVIGALRRHLDAHGYARRRDRAA